MMTRMLPLGRLLRLLRLRRPERVAPPAPLPEREPHHLDGLLLVLARGTGEGESARLFVEEMSLREAWFRCPDALPQDVPLQLQFLLSGPSGTRTVTGTVRKLVPAPGGFRGRLEMTPDSKERRHLESFLRRHSTDLASRRLRPQDPPPWGGRPSRLLDEQEA